MRGEGLGELGWGLPGEPGVWPLGIVVFALGGQRDARGARTGRGSCSTTLRQAIVEAFDEGILGRLSGGDVMPVKLAIMHKLQDRVRGELGPIVADSRLGLAAAVEQRR